MSNKMKKYFFLFFLSLTITILSGYEPTLKDFINPYQFELYRSWLQKSDCRPDAPAAFTANKVTKLYEIAGSQVKIEFDWTAHKITNQREALENYQHSLSPEIRHFLGSFFYRFNSADSIYAKDFLENTGTGFLYKRKENIAGFELFWQEKGADRLNLNEIVNIELNQPDNSLTVYLPAAQLILILKDLKIDLSELIEPESAYEVEITIPPEIPEEPASITVDIPGAMSLKEYISRNYWRKQSREMLHNKIDSVEEFLKAEFPGHDITSDQENYSIRSDNFQQFPDLISISYDRQEDGINLIPDNSYRIEDKVIDIAGETIDLSKLDHQEINTLAPYLPQLLYEHRAIGTRLLDFLLVHDNVPTTLLVKTEEREKYEVASYADLILMLNKYWVDRKVYFQLKDFKKVNNYIEFKGFLLAVDADENTADSAEIWFHLDKEFRIDLIMMMLYPEVIL